MTNATILIDAENLHRPLTTVQARFACSFSARLIKVPQSVYDLFIRIFRAGTDAYFDCPCSQDANGDWNCYVIGTCFPSVGEANYEVHGTDESGNPTSLGCGRVIVDPFSVNGQPLGNGATITVAQIPDEDGNFRSIVAVNIGTAEKQDWTWKIGGVVGRATGNQPPVGLMPDGLGAVHHITAADIGYGEVAPKTKIVDGK